MKKLVREGLLDAYSYPHILDNISREENDGNEAVIIDKNHKKIYLEKNTLFM